MSKPNASQIDRNEAAADIYQAMRDIQASLLTRVVVEQAERTSHNERVDADMERMLREAGW